MISILKVFRNIRFFLQLFKYFLLIEISLLNFAAKKKKKKKKENKKKKKKKKEKEKIKKVFSKFDSWNL